MNLQPAPDNAPNPVPDTPPKAVTEVAQKAALPTKPAPLTISAEVTLIIREKVMEAAKELRKIIGLDLLEPAIETETKRRVAAIIKDAQKYARQRAKSEKISPRDFGDAVFDQHGITRDSRRAEKVPKKAPPSDDQKGGDHGSK